MPEEPNNDTPISLIFSIIALAAAVGAFFGGLILNMPLGVAAIIFSAFAIYLEGEREKRRSRRETRADKDTDIILGLALGINPRSRVRWTGLRMFNFMILLVSIGVVAYSLYSSYNIIKELDDMYGDSPNQVRMQEKQRDQKTALKIFDVWTNENKPNLILICVENVSDKKIKAFDMLLGEVDDYNEWKTNGAGYDNPHKIYYSSETPFIKQYDFTATGFFRDKDYVNISTYPKEHIIQPGDKVILPCNISYNGDRPAECVTEYRDYLKYNPK